MTEHIYQKNFTPVHSKYSACIFFQPSMHDCTSQYHTGKQRISIVPVCAKSIHHTSLLDTHSTCIVSKYGETMEVVHQTNDKNMSTITLSTTETISSYTALTEFQ